MAECVRTKFPPLGVVFLFLFGCIRLQLQHSGLRLRHGGLAARSTWDLGSPTRDGTYTPCFWKPGVLTSGPPGKSPHSILELMVLEKQWEWCPLELRISATLLKNQLQ